ncbi:hypothetical protein HK098_004937 [Nowakowskiella sp. JEL0407]|nr:hypothetical protein HK098_004937 [Nowakowskiella sp. JEL0407]
MDPKYEAQQRELRKRLEEFRKKREEAKREESLKKPKFPTFVVSKVTPPKPIIGSILLEDKNDQINSTIKRTPSIPTRKPSNSSLNKTSTEIAKKPPFTTSLTRKTSLGSLNTDPVKKPNVPFATSSSSSTTTKPTLRRPASTSNLASTSRKDTRPVSVPSAKNIDSRKTMQSKITEKAVGLGIIRDDTRKAPVIKSSFSSKPVQRSTSIPSQKGKNTMSKNNKEHKYISAETLNLSASSLTNSWFEVSGSSKVPEISSAAEVAPRIASSSNAKKILEARAENELNLEEFTPNIGSSSNAKKVLENELNVDEFAPNIALSSSAKKILEARVEKELDLEEITKPVMYPTLLEDEMQDPVFDETKFKSATSFENPSAPVVISNDEARVEFQEELEEDEDMDDAQARDKDEAVANSEEDEDEEMYLNDHDNEYDTDEEEEHEFDQYGSPVLSRTPSSSLPSTPGMMQYSGIGFGAMRVRSKGTPHPRKKKSLKDVTAMMSDLEVNDPNDEDEEPKKKPFVKSSEIPGVITAVDGSRVTMLTPVRASRKDRKSLGVGEVVTPVRRSARLLESHGVPTPERKDEVEYSLPLNAKIAAALTSTPAGEKIDKLLSSVDYAYVPNNKLVPAQPITVAHPTQTILKQEDKRRSVVWKDYETLADSQDEGSLYTGESENKSESEQEEAKIKTPRSGRRGRKPRKSHVQFNEEAVLNERSVQFETPTNGRQNYFEEIDVDTPQTAQKIKKLPSLFDDTESNEVPQLRRSTRKSMAIDATPVTKMMMNELRQFEGVEVDGN